jgi:3-(methylthio)propanoyl-CoA dehydrogenase
MHALLADMQMEIEPLACSEAQEALLALREATATMLQTYRQNAEHALAVAVPYLMLSGLAIGSWLMAKTQAIATKNLSADAEFYRSKQQIARCYFDHVLPETLALARIVANGAGAIVEADAALL